MFKNKKKGKYSKYIYINTKDKSNKRIIKNKIRKKKKYYNKHKSNKLIILLLSILIIFIIILSIIFGPKILLYKNNKNIYNEEIFDSLYESFNKSREFLDKSMRGILIQDKDKFKSSENPKISVVIPVYNSQEFIDRSIKSIQNQNILNLEIILVNDYSKDETLPFIENKQIEDPRIKIINNKKNMGILYSRSIGALSSKGEYIFPLDHDDMFLNNDIFETISKIADKGNFDIVQFRGVLSLLGRSNILDNPIKNIPFSSKKVNNLVLFQPELSNYSLIPGSGMGNYDVRDAYLWGKCIRTKTYKKTLNKLGEEKYSRYMLAHEDILMVYALFNIAESYKYVGKYGIFRISREKSSFFRTKPLDFFLKELYLADVVIDFSKDIIEHKLLAVHLIIGLMKLTVLKQILHINENYKKLFISCLNRILNSNYISDNHKNEIRNRGINLKLIN